MCVVSNFCALDSEMIKVSANDRQQIWRQFNSNCPKKRSQETTIYMKFVGHYLQLQIKLHWVKIVRIQTFSGPNAGKYKPKKLRIRILFTQCYLLMRVTILQIYFTCRFQLYSWYGAKYSRMDRVKFVEDSLQKTLIDITANFLKTAFLKFYLVHSCILCLIYITKTVN